MSYTTLHPEKLSKLFSAWECGILVSPTIHRMRPIDGCFKLHHRLSIRIIDRRHHKSQAHHLTLHNRLSTESSTVVQNVSTKTFRDYETSCVEVCGYDTSVRKKTTSTTCRALDDIIVCVIVMPVVDAEFWSFGGGLDDDTITFKYQK